MTPVKIFWYRPMEGTSHTAYGERQISPVQFPFVDWQGSCGIFEE